MPIFNHVVLDPTLIHGVYNTCDQWCMYCPVTERCIAYRCSPELRDGKQNVFQTLADRLYEGMAFYKRACDAQGTSRPELDAILADDPRGRKDLPKVDDPLECAGVRYARVCGAYLVSRGDYPFDTQWHATGPTALEVVAWFQTLIAIKIYRALYCSAEAARGDAGKKTDAIASAKVALIGIDRSLESLIAIATNDDDPRLELLQGHLRRLKREMEGRFPEARTFVREGLD
jgi:hypothetical protein